MEWLVERSRGDLSTIRSYSQSALIALPADVSGPALERALQTILDRHDVLRARLDARLTNSRSASQGASPPPTSCAEPPSCPPAAKQEFVAAAETAMQDASSRLDPEHGKMISAVWLDPVSSNGDRAEAGRLLLVLHHLAVDGVSWRMLVTGLVTAYASAFDGETPILPPGGTSIRRWATALAETAAQRRDEIDLWSRMRTDEPLLGARGLDPAVDVGATVDRVSVDVPTSVTENVISTVPQHFGGSVNDGLLAALAIAVTAWRRSRGQRSGGRARQPRRARPRGERRTGRRPLAHGRLVHHLVPRPDRSHRTRCRRCTGRGINPPPPP